MKRKKMVLIDWVDSNVTHGWRLNNGLKFDDVAHAQHLGFLEYEDDEKITVSFGDSNCGTVMETITIPRGCIKSIKELRIK